MNNIGQFLHDINTQTGFKAKLRRKLFNATIKGLEAVQADIDRDEERLVDCEKKLAELSAQVAELREEHDALRGDFESSCVNLRNNNSVLERLSSDTELVKLRLSSIQKNMGKVSAQAAENAVQSAVPAPVAAAESDYESIDYFDFENHFRGSIESIKKSQEFYLKYFSDKKNVVDIGCGRGEFLSLMRDNGINARGVDIYEPYAEYCNMNGLNASCGDGSDFLSQLDEVDGIFVGQVVEHLKPNEIVRLCNTAYEKLSDGGMIVVETPNPTSLAIYTNAFYIDPSHIKPVHPLTMKYYLEKAGFRKIDIVYTESSRPQYDIPELKVQNAEDIEDFNEAMKMVSELLFGSQDYAVIAEKG